MPWLTRKNVGPDRVKQNSNMWDCSKFPHSHLSHSKALRNVAFRCEDLQMSVFQLDPKTFEVRGLHAVWFHNIGILLPKLFWPTVRKNCSSDRETFWNSRLKAENFQNSWDHKNKFFKQWKVRIIFGNRMLF